MIGLRRKQLPSNLREVLTVSKYITLYLVDSAPPATYLFSDPLNNCFRVTIEQNFRCNCLPGNNDHCMHTFYVLMKIFKLSENDPLLFQPNYTEEELEEIYSGARANKYQTEEKKKQMEKKIEVINSYESKREENMKQQLKIQVEKSENKSIVVKKEETIAVVQAKVVAPKPRPPAEVYQQPKFEQGMICSICYEPLQNQSPLIKCQNICFNFFHTKCLKFWIDYQKKQDLSISCPMCRSKIPQNISDKLKQAQANFVRFYLSFQVNCCECGQDIMMSLFRCLMCKEADVCKNCYFGWKHQSHDRYLMKKSKRVGWTIATPRNQANIAKLNVSLKYVKQFKDQEEMKIVFGPNYDKFLQANLKKETILEYMINSFTSISKEIYKTYKKLDYEEKDIRCMLCKKGKITQMRRLSCKHFIDQKCLSFLLINGQRQCPFDKQYFLPAFQTLALSISKK